MLNQDTAAPGGAKSGSAVSIKMSEMPVGADDQNAKSENGYNFTGVDSLQHEIVSFIMVPTAEQAMFELEKAGITVDSLTPRKTGGRKKKRAPNRIELATFAESFGEQMEIGGSPADICELIASDATNLSLVSGLKGAAAMIRNGSPVYLAFAAQRDLKDQPIFPITLIFNAKIAEETGATEDPETGQSVGAWFSLMRRFSEGLKEADAIAGQVKSASYYPVGIFGFCLVAVFFVLYGVMPKFKEMYAALLSGKDDSLPFITQWLMDASDFLLSWKGAVFMSAVAVGCYFLYKWFRSDAGKLWWQQVSLKIPVFGDFYKDMHAARALRTASMLASGEPDIKKRFAITAETCENIVYRRAFDHISHRLSAGLSLTEVCAPYSALFGSDFRGITRAVDEVGDMQGQFYRYAKILETRAKRKLERVIATFSTFAIVPVGIFIGGIVIALYAPMFQLVSRMSK